MANPLGATFTAVVQRDGDSWIGWVEEVPSVNCQGETREELLDDLRDALEEALGTNRSDCIFDSDVAGCTSPIQIVVKDGPRSNAEG